MGWFKAKAVIIRELNGIKIVFLNRNTIYVQELSNGRWHIFHIWYEPTGSYNGKWRQFRHLLLYEKGIDLRHCYRLAFRWDIRTQVTTTPPDLSKFKIEERI